MLPVHTTAHLDLVARMHTTATTGMSAWQHTTATSGHDQNYPMDEFQDHNS